MKTRVTDEQRKAKRKASHKAWREANKETIAARNKTYREANKDKIKAYNQSRYKDEAKMKAYGEAYYQANKERYLENQRNYRKENKETVRANRIAYDKANKEAKAARMKANYKSKLTHFVVYMHSNNKGDVYIGEGTNLRPYSFSNRTNEAWSKHFSRDTVKVEILYKFETKKEAQIKERELIAQIGLNNLVNTL